MKNYAGLFIFTLLSFTSSSQVWVEDNATWHYDYSALASGGFMKLYHDGDTLLAGENCKIIQQDRYEFAYDQFNDLFFFGVAPAQQYYVYSNADSVFWWVNGSYRLLFDFDAQVNDSWVIDISSAPGSLCDDTSKVIVVDNGIETIQGVDYRYIDLEPTPGSHYQMTGRYYERFGGGNFLFPLPYSCDTTIAIEYYIFNGLKCFEDDSLYYNPTGEDCQYYLTQVELGVGENSSLDLSMNPNPVINELHFSGPEVNSINVIDRSGRSYLSENIGSNQSVDLSSLPIGFYFVECKLINGLSVTKKLIKQ